MYFAEYIFSFLFHVFKRYRANQRNSNDEDSLQKRSVEGRDIRDDANKVTTGIRFEKRNVNICKNK